jgi:DNA-binding IclR family transcriptional regulator
MSSMTATAPRDGNFTEDRDFVGALARGLEVLRAFGAKDRFLGNGEIAQRTGLPKSTVVRLTKTLTALGYLNYVRRMEKYQLGVGVLSLGYALLNQLEIARIAAPLMRELASYSQSNLGLAMPDRLDMVYIESALGGGNTYYKLSPGERVPIESTALGQAYLGTLPENELNALLDHLKGARPEEFPRADQELQQAKSELQRSGFCIAEWQADIIAVAAPLTDQNGKCQYVFNLGGPKYMLSRERLVSDLGPRLVSLVNNVRRALPADSQ